MGKVAKFFCISRVERRLFLEAVFWCAVARLAIRFIPFRHYAWLLGKPKGEVEGMEESNKNNGDEPGVPPRSEEKEEEKAGAKKNSLKLIGHAVRRACRNVPWKTRCLVEAMAVKRMLHRKKIECTIYLGVAKENNGRMSAHAWLKSGDTIITGKKNHQKYTVISYFV